MALRGARQRGRVRHIRELAELDVALGGAYEAFQISEDAGRAALQRFDFIGPPDLPSDLRSEEYRQAQLSLYERIAGRPYTPTADRSIFDALASTRRTLSPRSVTSGGARGASSHGPSHQWRT